MLAPYSIGSFKYNYFHAKRIGPGDPGLFYYIFYLFSIILSRLSWVSG